MSTTSYTQHLLYENTIGSGRDPNSSLPELTIKSIVLAYHVIPKAYPTYSDTTHNYSITYNKQGIYTSS